MPEYILSCCSTVDLTKENLEKRNINYVPFHFYLNDKHYYDDLWQSISPTQFYKELTNDASVRTSQINTQEFIDYFIPFLEMGKDIIHISLSSGISGVYNSALIAKKELQEKYPERKIYIVDSLAASSGYGLIMDKLSELKNKENYDIDSLYSWIEENKLNLNHWFTSTDLTFFIKGGRISRVSGFFGGLLKICPVLHVDKMGKLIPVTKVRSKQKAINELLNKMISHAENGINYNQKCFISHSNCYNDALTLANAIQDTFKNLDGKVQINDIGPTVGCHTGPGTVALFFFGEKR